MQGLAVALQDVVHFQPLGGHIDELGPDARLGCGHEIVQGQPGKEALGALVEKPFGILAYFRARQEPEVVLVGHIEQGQAAEDSGGFAPFRAGDQPVVLAAQGRDGCWPHVDLAA